VADRCQQPLTLPQVAAAAEVEYRTLHTWLKRGLVRATCRSSDGAGTPNLFSAADALEARILADLRRAGLDLEALDRTARAIHTAPARLAGNELLLINGNVSVFEDEKQLRRELERPEPTFLYNVARARSALDEHLAQ
jgi:DNA-binding transcriptional MerR regulator